MSVKAVSEERSVEAVNEERSVKAVNEERSVKMTDKSVVGGEVAKTKTTEVPETATAEVSEAATAEVPEPTTAKTMTTKAYARYVSRMRYIDGRNSSRAPPACRKRQNGECNGRAYKLMPEHWTSPCAATSPAVPRAAGVKDRHVTATFRQNEWVAHGHLLSPASAPEPAAGGRDARPALLLAPQRPVSVPLPKI